MSVLVILICASLFIALLFLCAFVWATKKGQYDDSYTPSIRILFEDRITDQTEQPKKEREETKQNS